MTDNQEGPALDWLAMMDQLLRGMEDLGKLLHAHYKALVDAGFTTEQAMTLTVEYERLMALLASQQGDAE